MPSPPASPSRPTRALLPLFLLGATLGSALDAIHTHFGATQYPSPIFLRMAWWTPLLFGAAFAIGSLRPGLDVLLRRPPAPTPSAIQLGLTWWIFLGAYFSSVQDLAWPLVSALLSLYFLLGWLACGRDRATLAIALAAAVGGPAVEAILVWQGAFLHLQDTWLGVPGWLPFLYLNAAVALCTLARWLARPAPRP